MNIQKVGDQKKGGNYKWQEIRKSRKLEYFGNQN